MKITIIQFSPSGYTRKVTTNIVAELRRRNQEVQLVDMTGNYVFFIKKDIREFLSTNVKPHDVLLIGAPVYTHHLQYHVQDLIKELPKPDNKWGMYAIPYVCYGGISSGIALNEAAHLLGRSGRVVFAGMKVSAPHSMTRAFMETEFNYEKRQIVYIPEVSELIDRIVQLDEKANIKCHAKDMNYNGLATTLKAKFIFREKLWHKKRYPQINLDKILCINCGKCANLCPVKHLIKEDENVIENNQSPCIHCLNCVSACPVKAITLKGDLEKGKSFMSKMIAKNGNKEIPETAVY